MYEGAWFMDVTTRGAHAPDRTLDEYGPISAAIDEPMNHLAKMHWQSKFQKVACGLREVYDGRFTGAFNGEGEMVHGVKTAILATDESGLKLTVSP